MLLCTALLLAGLRLSLGESPAPGSPNTLAPRLLYFFFFSGAVVCAAAFLFLIGSNTLLRTSCGVALDLLGPFTIVLIGAAICEFWNDFKLHWRSFLSASVSWGFGSVFTSLLVAQNVTNPVDSTGWSQIVKTVCVLLAAAVFSALPVFASFRGVLAAYFGTLMLIIIFCSPLLRDMPFRVWHIGGLTKRVIFTDREEEQKARSCKLTALPEIKNAYSVWILSDLPGDVWYRCEPISPLKNGLLYIPRHLDSTKVLIEDY